MRWPQFKVVLEWSWEALNLLFFFFSFVMKLSLKQMNTCDTSLRRSIVVLNTTNCLSHTCKAPKLIKALHQRRSPSPSFWSCALLPPPPYLPIRQILQLCFCSFQISSQLLLQSFLKRCCHENHPQDLLHPCPWNWPKNINDENKQLKLHLFHNSFDFVPRTLIGIFQYRNCICHYLCNRGFLLLVLGLVLPLGEFEEKQWWTTKERIQSDRSIHANKFGGSKEGIQDYFTLGFCS